MSRCRLGWLACVAGGGAPCACAIDYPLEQPLEPPPPMALEAACVALDQAWQLELLRASPDEGPYDIARYRAHSLFCDTLPLVTQGWEGCAQPLRTTDVRPECAEQALPYLGCLADLSRAPSECLEPGPACLREPRDRPLDAPSTCVIRQEQHARPGNTAVPMREGAVFAYSLQMSECLGQASYGFVCESPAPGCVSTCACLRNGVDFARVDFDVSTDFTDQEIWRACDLPELAPEARK